MSKCPTRKRRNKKEKTAQENVSALTTQDRHDVMHPIFAIAGNRRYKEVKVECGQVVRVYRGNGVYRERDE